MSYFVLYKFKKRKMKTVKTTSFEMTNGDLVIGSNGQNEYREFFVKTSDGIFVYNEDEMEEVYGIVPADSNLLAKK